MSGYTETSRITHWNHGRKNFFVGDECHGFSIAFS